MQRTKPFAVRQRFVRCCGLRHELLFRNHRDHRIDLCIHPLNLLQVRLHDFACRELLGADRLHHIDRAHKTDLVPGIGVAVFRPMAVPDGPIAAESAVPVPSLRASRWVILLFIFLSQLPYNDRLAIGSQQPHSISCRGLPAHDSYSSQPGLAEDSARSGSGLQMVCSLAKVGLLLFEGWEIMMRGGNERPERSHLYCSPCAGPVLRSRARMPSAMPGPTVQRLTERRKIP